MWTILLRLVVDTTLVGSLMFGAAGTPDWSRGWALLVVTLLVRVGTAALVYPVNPTLLHERAASPLHADQSRLDRLLMLGVLATGFLALPAVAGLDRFHWRALGEPSPFVSGAGIFVSTLGWGIKGWALRANSFATTAIRLQPERNHAVVDRGPYAIIRHPFYAADPLIFLGQSVWLESYAAALCALVPTALMLIRLVVEDRFLRSALPGYREYANRVRYRVLPGVW